MKIVLSTSHLLTKLLHPKSGAIFAALDIGTNNVGVAITDTNRIFMNPLQNIVRKEGELRMKEKGIKAFGSKLNNVVNQHLIDVLVVGLPIHDNKLSPLCHEIIELMSGVEISRGSTLCTFFDESFSSMAAKNVSAMKAASKAKFLKEKDGLAASYILEEFLRNHGVAGRFQDAI